MAGRIIASSALAEAHPRPQLVRSGNFNPGVKAGPFVYVSGCGAKDTAKDMRGQAEEIFEYMALILAEVGYSMQDVVKIQAFVTDKTQYEGYNEVRRRYFPSDPPASTTVVSDLLFPGMLLEVEAVAYKE